MKPYALRLGWLLTLLLPVMTVLAQYQQSSPDDEAAAAASCAICAGGCLVYIAFLVAVIVLHIVLLVWVARDAKNRGMDSPALWIILIVFTGFVGLIVYILSRPKGDLVTCPHCSNKRMQVSAKCPHCGNP